MVLVIIMPLVPHPTLAFGFAIFGATWLALLAPLIVVDVVVPAINAKYLLDHMGEVGGREGQVLGEMEGGRKREEAAESTPLMNDTTDRGGAAGDAAGA